MIIKERVKLVLIAGHFIFAAWFLTYVFIPGYIIPLLNNPIGRLLILGCLGLFFINSFLLILMPKPGTGAAGAAIAFFMICSVTPNVLLPMFGPTFVTIGGCSF